MKAYQIGDQQGVPSLVLVDKPTPECGPGQAVLRVASVCLNHRDLKVIAGEYGPRRDPSRTPCSDGVGEVIAVGAAVTNVKVGDRATCGHFVNWLDGAFSPAVFGVDIGVSIDGWLSEEIVVPAAALVKAPHDLADAEIAPPAVGRPYRLARRGRGWAGEGRRSGAGARHGRGLDLRPADRQDARRQIGDYVLQRR